uniref:uncharacterized protein LOC122594937 n=1 Tax=Erigeron canadensis TaxID=72917 RepID=UPI001CB8A527|nr:uncharacterized protein LOC122594937 [Erigeron canadensis]
MKRKLITSIPDRYIIPRWTMKATYNVGSTGRWMGVNDHGAEEVSFMSLWSIRAKFNKALEEGRDSLSEIKRLDILLDDYVEEQYTRKNNTPEVDFENDSIAPTVTQVDMSQQFFVSDPILPVKTKGRPKVSTRMKSSIEKALEPKKKKSCAYCKGAEKDG